jgi:rhodanese-related sulfurtransferase
MGIMTKQYDIKWQVGLWIVILSIGILTPTAVTDDEALNDSDKRHRVKVMYANYKKSFPEVMDISAESALLKFKKGSKIIFVDVRKSSEQAISMLPGAITDREFLKNPDAYADHLVIGYCSIGYRSGKLAQKLKKKGVRMVNFRGGILAWLHAGGEIYKNGMPVNRVHVYGKKWDLAPSAYESVR